MFHGNPVPILFTCSGLHVHTATATSSPVLSPPVIPRRNRNFQKYKTKKYSEIVIFYSYNLWVMIKYMLHQWQNSTDWKTRYQCKLPWRKIHVCLGKEIPKSSVCIWGNTTPCDCTTQKFLLSLSCSLKLYGDSKKWRIKFSHLLHVSYGRPIPASFFGQHLSTTVSF